MAKVKDLRLNPPTKKTELTKESMLLFMKDESVSKKEKKWFVDLMNSNKVKKKNNLTGEIVETYDLPKVREEFALKYFPQISSKAKKNTKAPSKKKSFENELMGLLED